MAGSLGLSSLALTAISSAAAAALAVSIFERDGGPAKVRAAAVASDRASPRASSARRSAALAAGAGGEARRYCQPHGILDGNVERLDAVARQIQRVAAEGVAHRKVHRHPIIAAVRLQRHGDVFTGDETDGTHVAEMGQHDAL